ncbi:MAG: inner membrane protein YpjD [Gammaproteobacteria bacterium]
MLNNLLVLLAVIFYSLLVVLLFKNTNHEHYRIKKWWFISLIGCALLIHGGLLYHWIDVEQGQNLTYLNVMSQVFWIMVALQAILSLFKEVSNLGLILYPLAILSIISAWLMPGQHIIDTTEQPKQLLHLLLALLVVSIYAIACIQAILLAVQNYFLKHYRLKQTIVSFPSLETMELFLFQMLQFGFFVFTLVVITGFAFFAMNGLKAVWGHSLIALFAWFVFGVLVFGRTHFGWRGLRAVYWTFAGFIVLLLSYFALLLFN